MGVAAGFPPFVIASPVLQPAVVKLGDRGQHQFSLTGAVVVLSSTPTVITDYDSVTKTYEHTTLTYAGVMQAYLGYSYLF